MSNSIKWWKMYVHNTYAHKHMCFMEAHKHAYRHNLPISSSHTSSVFCGKLWEASLLWVWLTHTLFLSPLVYIRNPHSLMTNTFSKKSQWTLTLFHQISRELAFLLSLVWKSLIIGGKKDHLYSVFIFHRALYTHLTFYHFILLLKTLSNMC